MCVCVEGPGFGWGWQIANINPIDSTNNLVGSRLDFRCQHYTSGIVDVFLRVPSPAPGKMPKALVPLRSTHWVGGSSLSAIAMYDVIRCPNAHHAIAYVQVS